MTTTPEQARDVAISLDLCDAHETAVIVRSLAEQIEALTAERDALQVDSDSLMAMCKLLEEARRERDASRNSDQPNFDRWQTVLAERDALKAALEKFEQVAIVASSPMSVSIGWLKEVPHNTKLYAIKEMT